MWKKFTAFAMAMMMGLSLTAYGGSDSGSQDEGKGEEMETITYAFAAFTGVPSEITEVEKAINEITEKEINVHVNLEILSPANYSQQIALKISSGADLDMFHTLGDLNQYAAKHQIIPLDSLLDEYGTDIKNIEPEFFLKAGKIDDELYGIPFYMGKALASTAIYRQDILDELGISGEDIQSLEDLGDVFAQVHEKYPEMKCLVPLNAGDCGILTAFPQIDYLTDASLTPTAVLAGDSTTVVNYYETEEFEKLVKIAHEWNEKGYISSDAATTTNLASQELSAGTAFCAIGNYAGECPETQFAPPAEGYYGSSRLGDPIISTGEVNTLSRVISVNSKHPEAAMKFLNLCYTSNEISTLLTMGIEGRDYVKVDDQFLSYPEGQNMMTVPYNALLSAASSNQFIDGGLLVIGSSAEDRELQKQENESAWRSKAFGFTFNSSTVKAQYSAVNNVINQYLPGLRCGSLDPETELPKFIDALKAAGISDIVSEKQTQLDKWLTEQ